MFRNVPVSSANQQMHEWMMMDMRALIYWPIWWRISSLSLTLPFSLSPMFNVHWIYFWNISSYSWSYSISFGDGAWLSDSSNVEFCICILHKTAPILNELWAQLKWVLSGYCRCISMRPIFCCACLSLCRSDYLSLFLCRSLALSRTQWCKQTDDPL